MGHYHHFTQVRPKHRVLGDGVALRIQSGAEDEVWKITDKWSKDDVSHESLAYVRSVHVAFETNWMNEDHGLIVDDLAYLVLQSGSKQKFSDDFLRECLPFLEDFEFLVAHELGEPLLYKSEGGSLQIIEPVENADRLYELHQLENPKDRKRWDRLDEALKQPPEDEGA